MTTRALTTTQERALAVAGGILEDFEKFLRLHTADGDASPQTIRSYHTHAGQFVAWCTDILIVKVRTDSGIVSPRWMPGLRKPS